MRIPAEALRAIRTELVQAHQCGVTGQHFEPTSALNSLLVELDYHGVEIVPKAAAPGGVVRIHKSDAGRVETRVPEGNAEAEQEKPAVHPVTEAVREKLAEAIPGLSVFAYTQRSLTDEDVPRITVEWGKTVTRDLVLFNCEDYEGNAAAAKALGLDSYPLNEPVTLGWLVDEHAEFKQALQNLFWDLTNGCVSKPNTDLAVVHELAGKAFVVNLLDDHPELAADPLFRPAMEKHFSRGEIEAHVEIARRRLDGHRVVRIGAAGTFDLGKAVV